MKLCKEIPSKFNKNMAQHNSLVVLVTYVEKKVSERKRYLKSLRNLSKNGQ